jgi:hypothetical protein
LDEHALAQLPTLLTFTSGSGLVALLQREWLIESRQQVAGALDAVAERGAATRLRERLRALPSDVADAIVTAPHVQYMLRHHPRLAYALAFLDQGLDAEAASRGAANPRGTGLWSVLGDRYYPPDWPGRGTPAAEWSRSSAFEAPRLSNGVPIDFISPLTRGALPEIPGDDVPLTASDRDVALDKIECAVRTLARVVPDAARFIAALSRVIVVRTDSEPTAFSSASTALCLGRPVLRNCSKPDATPEWIADGLVHETVHCVIDLIEIHQPMIRDTAARPTTVRSGWTGRQLDLDTYLQACFVWFALWNVWSAAGRADAFDPAQVARLIKRAARGFEPPGIVRPLDAVMPALSDATIAAIEAAQSMFEEAR